jgi:putative phosphoribosyl transferase
MKFVDRVDAGRQLADKLLPYKDEAVVVVGLPRGGLPVAFEVARALEAPLDVILVRKIGVPFQPELAAGAIGEDGARVINEDVLREVEITEEELAVVEDREARELRKRVHHYRNIRPAVSLLGKSVVIVDDGVATGSTVRAACQVARERGASQIILAMPVAPLGWQESLRGLADEFVAVFEPDHLGSVGQFYRDFSQVSDDEATRCLDLGRALTLSVDENVLIDIGVELSGHLVVPERAKALIIFVHGSGSSRHSSRNRKVAEVLNDAGIATLLFDLLTIEEERSRRNVFDIEMLSERLNKVTKWIRNRNHLGELTFGYFGASTGAAAAICSAADFQLDISAVVSRGGRPDLAWDHLDDVRCPTLFIVGSEDEEVLALNRRAIGEMHCYTHLSIVPGATHLFEEPGALDNVAELARDWFLKHLLPQNAKARAGGASRR